MLVLGIETSGIEGSIALIREGQCLGDRLLSGTGRRHAQSLVLEIKELLSAAELTPRDVDAVAVSQGPGSFTGLRVGMTCAKTFAYATRCQFIKVDTFAAIADNLPAIECRSLIIEDAQRDDLFVGEYHRDGAGNWCQVRPIQIESVDKFQVAASTWNDVVTGPGLRKLDPMRIATGGQLRPEFARPTALSIATRGQRFLMEPSPEGCDDRDFWKATPFYLRQSAAEEKRAQA